MVQERAPRCTITPLSPGKWARRSSRPACTTAEPRPRTRKDFDALETLSNFDIPLGVTDGAEVSLFGSGMHLLIGLSDRPAGIEVDAGLPSPKPSSTWLPTARAGRMRQITLSDPEPQPDARPFVPLVDDDEEPEDDEVQRSDAYSNTPATATGLVRVFQGRSMFGPRGRVDMGLRWRDLPDDGRYVTPLSAEVPVATGMRTKGMVEWVQEQIAEVLLRLDRNL